MLNFLHIPKCGGSTVRNYIRSRFSEEIKKNPDACSVFVYGDQSKIGTINLSTLDDQAMNELFIKFDYFLGAVGHYTYNGLQLLLKGRCNTYGNTFTLVRDPVDRIISNINYIKSLPQHSGFKFASSITQDILVDYLISHAKSGAENYQCNLLGARISTGDRLNADQIYDSIFKNINVYKIESTNLALSNHVLSTDSNFSLIKKNVTSEISIENREAISINLLDRTAINNKDEKRLQFSFANDYLLYSLAK